MTNKGITCAPMGQRDKEIIENNEPSIVKLMDPDRITRLLLDKGVIDTDDRRQIMVPHVTTERNRTLIGKLLTRGPMAFSNYLNALRESGTDNHSKLASILRNDNPLQPIDEKIQDSRNKRISEKIDDHEQRLKYLEEGKHEIRSEDADSLHDELIRRNTELEELREKLKTRDGELREAKEENKLLQKRIQALEKKIQHLETYLKDQKVKMETLVKQQQQDRRANKQLEAKMDITEKKMEKKLQEQEKRHAKGMEEMKQMIKDIKMASSTSSSPNFPAKTANTTAKTPTTNSPPKTALVPRNRFQGEDKAQKPKPAATHPDKPFKKSSAYPEQLPPVKPSSKTSK